ncbi:CBS domain-containing protein [Priestia megaterium]|uniref:CBS domain-containing protein n=1 Tax=Priestia megaterium TaxID=1404 RepID=UPI002E22F425|nr:CBS domain-containing protein [Priestia megaterium]MED4268389.1 CBS domain-containing protein [Priestia megaterium]MED4279250.1 CBS domain-containing protein [Priestia megaterium]MED4314640.1 CBS domain-containing protein [Priestia megaterium]
MNIAFFLIPKREVVCIDYHSTLRQALEKMEYHRYTAVPLIDKDGKYVGTLTEGDLLWKMKNTPDLSFENTHKRSLTEIQLNRLNDPIHIDAEIEDIIGRAMEQNFVPVVDDKDIFIGIIRRREIIEYCAKNLLNKSTI